VALLWMVIVGVVVGLVARVLMPGPDSMGLLADIGLGLIGSIVSGILGQVLGLYHQDEPAGFLATIAGAAFVLFIFHAAARSREGTQL